MAKLNIGVILMAVSLFIAMQTSGNHARKQGPDGGEEEAWLRNLWRGTYEKRTTFDIYIQDELGGSNPTVYEVARASITSNSPTGFGQVRVLDDLVTAGPDRNSKKLGRAQGLITFSDLETSALTMNLNIVFTSGEYKGSTICILGRNQIMDETRELAVVGGTGAFRYARGYAISSTYDYNITTDYGILKYTIDTTYVAQSNLRLRTAVDI